MVQDVYKFLLFYLIPLVKAVKIFMKKTAFV